LLSASGRLPPIPNFFNVATLDDSLDFMDFSVACLVLSANLRCIIALKWTYITVAAWWSLPMTYGSDILT